VEEQQELPKMLDTATAPLLRDDLLAMRRKDVRLSAAGVRLLGARCAEVLLSAARLWAMDGKSLSIADASEAFQRDLEILGLSLDEVTTS
jgi:chemotaxis protein CheX